MIRKLSPTDLTLEEAQRIEDELDVPWAQIVTLTSIRYVLAIATTLLARDRPLEVAEVEAKALTVSDPKASIPTDDMPDYYENSMPKGGRSLDSYICAFGLPPFHWPPDVTRRQTFRDLHMISEAAQCGAMQ